MSNHTAVYQEPLKKIPEAVEACMLSRSTGNCSAEVTMAVVHHRRRLVPHPRRTWSRASRPSPVLVVGLPAHLDETNAVVVKAELKAAAAARPHVVVADMSETTCCDWAGAGALVSAFSSAAAHGAQLRIVLTDETVRRVLSLNGLDRIIPIYADVALASDTP